MRLVGGLLRTVEAVLPRERHPINGDNLLPVSGDGVAEICPRIAVVGVDLDGAEEAGLRREQYALDGHIATHGNDLAQVVPRNAAVGVDLKATDKAGLRRVADALDRVRL